MVLGHGRRIGRCVVRSLILFSFLSSCSTNSTDTSAISVYWHDSVPAGLVIPRGLVPLLPDDSVKQLLEVHLLNDRLTEPVIGDFIFSHHSITFQSVVPLTRSLTYQLRFDGQALGELSVPPGGDAIRPEVVAVYPTQDSLPENLLKIYIQFSRPMRESDPLDFLFLLTGKGDTVRDVFLDMRPALWDREGKMLTLWLDPGRIKRDLQPNRQSGPPLREGEVCELVIMDTWPSKNGMSLKRSFSKKFLTIARDESSPDISGWQITAPEAGTLSSLVVRLRESLDFVLLMEALDVVAPDGSPVNGSFGVSEEETLVVFTPKENWKKGTYEIRCESRLEDLAGNNLNRLFDQDVRVSRTGAEKNFYEVSFTIR